MCKSDVDFEVEYFNNCRETGFGARIIGGKIGVCLYEHKNSDNVIVRGCADWDTKPEYGCYGIAGDTKYNYIKGFDYGKAKDFHLCY